MKKYFALLAAVLFLPFFASAATLNNTFNVGTYFPTSGSTTSVSSSCGISGANSSVGFVLMQNGTNTPLATNLNADSNGMFTGNVTFPTNYSGTATLVATCNSTGNTVSSPVLNFALPASSSFNLPQTSPTLGGLYNLSGSCGSSNGSGSVQLILTYNGNTYPLDTPTLSPTGTFSDNVVIPSNLGVGSGVFKAVCSNGVTFSSNINIGPAAVNMFGFSTNPVPGANVNVSGSCANISGNQNGTASFTVLRSGSFSNLSATNSQTNGSGYFNSSVYFPSDVGSQPATFVVTCPNGSTFSNVIMLGAVDPSVVVPVGGVAAGSGPNQEPNYFLAGALLMIGLFGLVILTHKNLRVQK